MWVSRVTPGMRCVSVLGPGFIKASDALPGPCQLMPRRRPAWDIGGGRVSDSGSRTLSVSRVTVKQPPSLLSLGAHDLVCRSLQVFGASLCLGSSSLSPPAGGSHERLA